MSGASMWPSISRWNRKVPWLSGREVMEEQLSLCRELMVGEDVVQQADAIVHRVNHARGDEGPVRRLIGDVGRRQNRKTRAVIGDVTDVFGKHREAIGA